MTAAEGLRERQAVGQPATSRTLPAGQPPTDLEAAFQIAAQTGQPVIGAPMSDEEAA